jgi:hypothetical protein
VLYLYIIQEEGTGRQHNFRTEISDVDVNSGFWDTWWSKVSRRLNGVSRSGTSYDLLTLEDEGVRSQKVKIKI